MKLFNLGKKKDRNVDEYVIGENINRDIKEDMERDINVAEDHIIDNDQIFEEVDENISDYIDLDDLNFRDYEDIVDVIEENGWHVISDLAYSITNFDTRIVSQKTVDTNHCSTLEIKCPPKSIIGICGLDECGVDMDNFYNEPNTFQVPHFLSLICTDVNGVAIPQTTLVSILKSPKDGVLETLYQEFYGDLSPVIDGKLKKKEERYYFTNTIILQDGEKLIFKICDQGINVSKIDILMLSDLFEKDEE
jgi:hypothetical protein